MQHKIIETRYIIFLLKFSYLVIDLQDCLHPKFNIFSFTYKVNKLVGIIC